MSCGRSGSFTADPFRAEGLPEGFTIVVDPVARYAPIQNPDSEVRTTAWRTVLSDL